MSIYHGHEFHSNWKSLWKFFARVGISRYIMGVRVWYSFNFWNITETSRKRNYWIQKWAQTSLAIVGTSSVHHISSVLGVEKVWQGVWLRVFWSFRVVENMMPPRWSGDVWRRFLEVSRCFVRGNVCLLSNCVGVKVRGVEQTTFGKVVSYSTR